MAALDLPNGHWALFGSCPMLAHGLIERVNDIDIVARGAAWERAASLAEVRFGRHDRFVSLPGEIEIFDGWLGGDIDALIDSAELVRGLPFVGLAEVLRFKQILLRPKDRRHIELLQRHLARRSGRPRRV